MTTLQINDLHVDVETEAGPKQILKGVDLTINSGEVHAIMGPNGSGKSTLAYTLAGHPKYTITSGTVTLDGVDLPDGVTAEVGGVTAEQNEAFSQLGLAMLVVAALAVATPTLERLVAELQARGSTSR